MDKYDKYMAIGIKLFILLMFVVIIIAVALYTKSEEPAHSTLRNEIISVPMWYEEAGES